MAFNPNYSLMNQGSANLANATAGIGQQIGQGIGNIAKGYHLGQQREQAAEQQAQMNSMVQAAMDGNQEALSLVGGVNPELGMKIQEHLVSQQTAQSEDIEKNTIEAVQRLYKAKPEQQQALLQQMIADPSLDIDEADIPYINDENIVRAGLTDYYGKDYADAFFGGTESTANYQQGTGSMSGYSFNPNTGEFSINPEIKKRLIDVADKPALDVKDRAAINKDFTALTKDTKLIRNTAADLSKLATMKNASGEVSGPSSIAMVFKFMKALDPTSVVREGEFATAENSSGIPENIRNIYNKLMQGGRLGSQQVNEFVTTAKGLANSAIDSSTGEVASFLNTFEGTIPDSFRDKVIGRIPKRFDIDKPAPIQEKTSSNDNPATTEQREEFAGFKVVR